MPDEQPFGFMLRKPGARVDGDFGDETPVYAAPGFDEPQPAWQTHAGSDPRLEPESEWALALPHHCDEWNIGDGSREDVLAEAKRFRAELDAAIAVMEAAADA
jgi:hypothetical protein